MFSPSPAHQTCPKRPIAIRKSLHPPSVSFVTAIPQQTRSSVSAVNNLPDILRRAMPHDPPQPPSTVAIDNVCQPPVDGSSQSPPLNAIQEADQSIPVLQGPTPTSPLLTPDQAPLTPHVDQPLPKPSSAWETVSQGSPTQPLSNKRSWFNVFWSRDKETSVAEVKVEADSAQGVPEAIHIHTELAVKSDHLETINPQDSTGPTGAIPLPDVRHLLGDAAPAHSIPVLASLLPEPAEQPASQPSPALLSHHSPVHASENSVSPTGSNPVPSLFAFNFPVLTKSRPPPETVVVPPPLDISAQPSSQSSVATSGDACAVVSLNVTEASIVHVSEGGVQSPSNAIAEAEVRTSTWWTYLGWNDTSTVQVDGAPPNPSFITDHTTPANPGLPAPDPMQPECNSKDQMNSSDGNSTERVQVPDEQLPTVQNGDLASAPNGSTWYTPWSWYKSSPSNTTVVVMDTSSDPQQISSERDRTGSKTEEKRHTGDPQIDAALNEAPLPLASSAIGSVDYGNPVQSVISANPTGWMSFFTAKAIAMKSITHEKEDGAMEVMDIDDDMGAGPSDVLLEPSATHPLPIQVGKPPLQAQPHTSDAPALSSPPLKKFDDKRTHMPHAVTYSDTVSNESLKRQPSPSPSKKSSVKSPTSPPPPNLVLPSWKDTFHTPPRSEVPREVPSTLSKTLQYVSGVLLSWNESSSNKGKGKTKENVCSPFDKALPRTWDVLDGAEVTDVLKECKRVVVIGVHGWFPGTVLRTLAGEPTGTSSKFVNGFVEALDLFQAEHKVKLDKITKIPLEGEGTINRRVERLYQILTGNKEWMDDLHDADVIFFATHSQGSVVSTHILDRLIADRHIRTTLNADASIPASGVASGSIVAVRPPQRICCLALCGIHLGPLRYLSTSSLVQPYIQYFESTAARELFEFQNTESPISRDYVRALRNVLNNGVKMVFIASLNDQVVGLYSGLFTSVSHPLILRALYIDGDAYHPSDFLSNLLVLLVRIRNAGLSDGGLLTHLSEATAGSLNGIGHSTPYEERATYSLAINYAFLTDGGSSGPVELVEEPFNALAERNDYEIPWALRDLVADDGVAGLFSGDIVALRDAFRDWHPKTTVLRDVKRKLQPIQRLSSLSAASRTSRL